VLRFGTDGVRGDAETELPSEFVVALGRAIAAVAAVHGIVLIGRDTRASGLRIEADLARGMAVEGVKAVSCGVLPTPAMAFLTGTDPAAVISASHNPWTDNGVKVIGVDGRKLPDEAEAAIERALEAFVAQPQPAPSGMPVEVSGTGAEAYTRHLVEALDGRDLRGLRVVLDCANGAAFEVAPRVFAQLGAGVDAIFASPDGRNINAQCGSMHPEALQLAVVERGADLGLAFDGDADRVIAVDENGAVVDGDQIITMSALDLAARGLLRNNAVAVTVMSNLGLQRALAAAGIGVVRTPVGDRHVVAAMQARDLVLGGEQSGHVVYASHATTGDGTLTGLLLCDLVRRSGRPLSELAAQMTRYPQVLANVRVRPGVDLEQAEALWEAVRAVERELGTEGRVLVRASGTEPLVRVMAEAESEEQARQTVTRLCALVEAEFGAAAAP
jgi:phosphoglucosamine mutase